MNLRDWQDVKENLQRCYNSAAQWFLFGNMALFLAACIVAGGPVGPIAFINFLYYCCHWNAK